MRCIRLFRNGLLALTLAFPAGSALAAEPEGATAKVRVDGLACPFCAYGLEKKLKAVEGVTGLEIDLDEGLAIVHFAEDARVDEDVLAEKVREAGFTPRGITVEEPSEGTTGGGGGRSS